VFAAPLLVASKVKAGEDCFQVEGGSVELVSVSIDPQQVTFAKILEQPARFSEFSPSASQHFVHLFV
jgi:hypothetical protein